MKARIVVVALALLMVALGVTLGAGPLQQDAKTRDRVLAREQAAVVGRDHRIVALQGTLRFASAYTEATAARVVAGALTGRTVAVISFPGTDVGTLSQLKALVTAAGGVVTADVALAPGLLDPADEGIVGALTSQMAAQVPGTSPAGALTYHRFGGLLARATGLTPTSSPVQGSYDTPAISIVSGFQTAKLIGTATITARAALALVVAPSRLTGTARGAALALLGEYAAHVPTVFVAPGPAALPGGLLAELRASATAATMTTVDTVESPMGRVAAVLGLAARVHGIKGAYGQVAGAVPPAS